MKVLTIFQVIVCLLVIIAMAIQVKQDAPNIIMEIGAGVSIISLGFKSLSK